MRAPSALFLAMATVALGACQAGAPQQAMGDDRCREFALSGGYPFLEGGPIYGPNQSIERLPGAPPLFLSGHGQSHLDEEQYLYDWCRKNLN